MKKISLLAVLIIAMLFSKVSAQKTAYTITEVNKILKDMHLYLNVELEDSVKSKAGFVNAHYLIPLTNYIDYNVIGRGKVATIDDDGLREFITKSIQEGKPMSQISKELISEFNRLQTLGKSSVEKEDVFRIGGFFVGETEHHQEPDGRYMTMIEINQFRLFFASHLNSGSKANNVDIFAEYNPISEEVIHQIDEAVITKGSSSDTLFPSSPAGPMAGMPGMETDEEAIPFERLFVALNNVGGTRLNLTVGQFRNPFGQWSDYSSHRNFTSTKNNTLVNGFALKKVELGLKADYILNKNWQIEAAIVGGRFGRTAPLFRADFDNKKDFVTHISYSNNRFTAGASGYFSEFSFDKRTAYGLDFGYRFDKLLVSGEYVIQRNKEVNLTAPNIALFVNELSSDAAYAQFDYELSSKLHVYGLYDYWHLKADGKTVNKPAYKIFHGIKYFINAKTRWTIVEYGHMFHDGFDKGFNHISTQLEVSF